MADTAGIGQLVRRADRRENLRVSAWTLEGFSGTQPGAEPLLACQVQRRVSDGDELSFARASSKGSLV